MKTYPDLKIDTEDSIANKNKVNVNYESKDLKNQSQWQITTSRNKHGHSTNAGKVTLERNRKPNEIDFKLSNRFSSLHVDQNLTRPTSTIPNIPEKIPTNSRNTSPHASNTVQNKGPLVCTAKNYLKISYLLQFQVIMTMPILSKAVVKFLLWVVM